MEATESDPKEEDALETKFVPPLYIQRYQRVLNILKERKPKTVVDFGCAEMKFFWYLKSLKDLRHIYVVDVDEGLLKSKCYLTKPLPIDYLIRRENALIVETLAGDITFPDSRLKNVDAFVAIELIEHLMPPTLLALPQTVFGVLKPKIAIFTTPNYEFNKLFKTEGFRHWDHKFEWTRNEFQKWCSDVLENYSNYSVTYDGIGDGPEGTEYLGCCSQMAIFERKFCEVESLDLILGKRYLDGTRVNDLDCTWDKKVLDSEGDEECDLSRDEKYSGLNSNQVSTDLVSTTNRVDLTLNKEHSDLTRNSDYSSLTQDNENSVRKKEVKISTPDKDLTVEYPDPIPDINDQDTPYKLIARYEYPWEKDSRSEEQKFYEELKYRVNSLAHFKYFFSEEDCNKTVIPVDLLLDHVSKWCSDESSLIPHLRKIGNGKIVQMESGLGLEVERSLPSSDSEDLGDNETYHTDPRTDEELEYWD